MLCDCDGEGVWDGLDAFFEARETGEFADMAFDWGTREVRM